MKGYKIDFTTNTITMNYKFAAAASKYGSQEYTLIRQIKSDFPELREQIQPGRVIKNPRPNKRLTYKNMEAHITAYENAEELMEAFKTVRTLSKPLASPYKFVWNWFLAQFPNYKKTPVLEDGTIKIAPVPIPEVEDYKLKIPA